MNIYIIQEITWEYSGMTKAEPIAIFLNKQKAEKELKNLQEQTRKSYTYSYEIYELEESK